MEKCITVCSASGICGNRACAESHGIRCCKDYDEKEHCNSVCGWLRTDWCDWRNYEIECPASEDVYLVIINGKYGKVTYENAYMIATYSEKEGWIVEGLEEYENVNVRYWLPLPKMSEGIQ